MEKSKADSRAACCLMCPLHESESTYEKPGEKIKALFAWKHERNLHTKHDKDLGMCGVCGCHLKLKVWEPIHLILKQTNPSHWNRYDAACWQKAERNNL